MFVMQRQKCLAASNEILFPIFASPKQRANCDIQLHLPAAGCKQKPKRLSQERVSVVADASGERAHTPGIIATPSELRTKEIN